MWMESSHGMFIHPDTIELKRLLQCKKSLLAIKRDLTKPVPRGGWNTERVYVQDVIKDTEARIKLLKDKDATVH